MRWFFRSQPIIRPDRQDSLAMHTATTPVSPNSAGQFRGSPFLRWLCRFVWCYTWFSPPVFLFSSRTLSSLSLITQPVDVK